MTVAELTVLVAVVALLVWLFRPLQRLVRDRLERWMLRSRHGKVIEGKFRPVAKPPDDAPKPDAR